MSSSARRRTRRGSYEEAGAYYLKALELDPTDRVTAINAANAYIRAENAGRAAEALEYLIAIDPSDPAPYNTLKQLYPDAALAPAARHPAFAAGRAEHGRRPASLSRSVQDAPVSQPGSGGLSRKRARFSRAFCKFKDFCCIFAQFAKILPRPLTNTFRRGILSPTR